MRAYHIEPLQNKKVLAVSLLLWMTVLINSAGASVLSNLLSNADFETENGTYPVSWTFVVSGSASATYIKTGTAGADVYVGTHGVTIENPGSGSDRWCVTSSAVPSVTPGTLYEFSVRVKTENFDADDFVRLDIAWLDANKAPLGNTGSSSSMTGNSNWHKISFTASAPAGAVYARPLLIVNCGATPSSASAKATFDNAEFGTVLCNIGFETENGALPASWTCVVGTGATGTYVTAGTAGEDVYRGTHAVSITQPDGNSDRWCVTNSFVPGVVPGTSYELSARVKTENFDADDFVRLEIAWLDSNKSPLPGDPSSSSLKMGSDDWRRISFTATAPSGAAYARPLLVVGCGSTPASASAKATFDDAEFGLFPELPRPLVLPLANIDLSSWQIQGLGQIQQITSEVIVLTIDSPDHLPVQLTPPSPISLPDDIQRLGGWYARCEGNFDIAYLIRDGVGNTHTVSTYTSAPYYGDSDVTWEVMPLWSGWKQCYSLNIKQPTEADLTTRVIPEYQQAVRQLVWPSPLQLVGIQISPLTDRRNDDAQSAQDLADIASGHARLALSKLWILDQDELTVPYAWYNHGRRRIGWLSKSLIFPDDMTTESGPMRFRVEVLNGYQGPGYGVKKQNCQ